MQFQVLCGQGRFVHKMRIEDASRPMKGMRLRPQPWLGRYVGSWIGFCYNTSSGDNDDASMSVQNLRGDRETWWAE